MKLIKNILILIWKSWFILLTSTLVIVIGILWVYPLSYSVRTFPLAYKGIRLWAILSFYGLGFRMTVNRKKELENNRAYIFISNHTSILDIMVMAILHKHHPIVFVGKEELAHIPIFGKIYKRICIVVNRKDLKSRTHVFKLAKERIGLRESLVIFPEGGIPDNRKVRLAKFKDGPFTIGISTGTPIVVYTINGLKKMFPEVFFEGHPGRIQVNLIEIIEVNDLTLAQKDEIKMHCFKLMDADLNN